MTGVESETLTKSTLTQDSLVVEETTVSVNNSFLCMLPDWLLLLFSIEIEGEAKVLNDTLSSTDLSSHGNDSPTKSDNEANHSFTTTDEARHKLSSHTMTEKPLAGCSIPLMTPEHIKRLPSDYTAPYCCTAAASSYQLRTGPDYYQKKRKAPSAEAFMDLVGMDFIRTPQGRLDDIGKHVRFPQEWKSLNTPSNANPKIPPLFIVNVQGAEVFKHSMFGYPLDTPGTAFVFYFKLKQETMDSLSNLNKAPPALRLFADYVANGPEAYSEMMKKREENNNPTGIYDNKYFGKFKVCLRCDNIKDPSMSWLPSVAVPYNEKPVVITYSGTLLRGPGYVEMDIDTRQFGILAAHTMPTLMRNLHYAINTVAFCVESVEECEMPERAFGVATMNRFNCSEDVPTLEPHNSNNSNNKRKTKK